MGVAGLWEVLRPAGQVRSLTELAVEDGFNANPSQLRGFRIGIDASIWFFHAAYSREGENPELRTLFFRCCRLLQSPLLPLFVFDGPHRPAVKRGKRVGGNVHWLTQGMKNIIDAFGFEWRVAPGEAEAELAYLNRVGIIDAVLSDDVDNFLFGATMVIRNPSNTLSGNRAYPAKNAQGKDDGNHVVTYTAEAILSDPSVSLSRSGTILIGLLSGGDYIPTGLPGCGQKFATGLARAGFGDSLVKAVKEFKGARLDAFLDRWRQDIKNELRTNKRGFLPSKKPSLAASLPDEFPSLPVLMSYVDPLTSENTHQKSNKTSPGVWRSDPDPHRIASLCELYFEWGVKDVIVQRFRTVLWPGIVCRAVRRAVVNKDIGRQPSSPIKEISSTLTSLALYSPSRNSSTSKVSSSDPSASEPFMLSSLLPLASPASLDSPCSATSTPSEPSPLLLEVVSQRTHASTDSMLEYRILVDPTALVERAKSGVKGLRPPLVGGLFGTDPDDEDDSALDQDADESGSEDVGGIERLETAAGAASKLNTKKRKARREVPTKPLRLWLPACMMRLAAPALVEAYDDKLRVREEKKAKRGEKGARGRRAGTGNKSTSRAAQVKGNMDDDADDSASGPSTSKKATRSRLVSKTVRSGGGGRRRKPKQASEAQDDAYELIDLSAGERPCSSEGESVEENVSKKGKVATNKNAKTNATNKAKVDNTMKEYFNTTKPSTARACVSKPKISRPPAAKTSPLDPLASRCIYEEEDSTDAVPAARLSKHLRPLDLLRAKAKQSSTTAPKSPSKSTSKSTPTFRRYEEEESSSSSLHSCSRPYGSKPDASSRSAEAVPRTRKKPLFVEVSDSDSEIEVSDIRHPSPGTTTAITSCGVRGDMTQWMSVGTDGTLSTSLPTASLSPVRTVSVPLGADTIDAAFIVRPASSPSHILLPQPTLESEEGSEEDELPMFHRGSTSSTKRTTIVRHVPRPFPMQFAPEPLATPSRFRGEDRVGYDENDHDDAVEIADVFTTPRGPSPPGSPTPSPTPIKTLPVHTSTGLPVVYRYLNEFPASPTKPMTQTNDNIYTRTKHRHHMSSQSDSSGNKRNGIPKSPRKSTDHSSPRHARRTCGHDSSRVPNSTSHADRVISWAGDTEARDASTDHRPQPGDTEWMRRSDGVGWKLRRSDISVISISSGSEDEGNTELCTDRGVDGEGEAHDDYTDQDTDDVADKGMILSAPPSPAAAAGADGFVPSICTIGAVFSGPARVSKFKPSLVRPKMDAHTPSVDLLAPANITSGEDVTDGQNTVALHLVSRAPLLVARTKRSKGRDDDVIDLTSD